MLIEFVGAAGIGKSYLSKALYLYLIKKNYKVNLIKNRRIFDIDTYINAKNNLDKIKIIIFGILFIILKLIIEPFDSIKLITKTFKSKNSILKKIEFLITYLQYTFNINNNYRFLSFKKNNRIIKIVDGSKLNILHEFIFSDSLSSKDSKKLIVNSNYKNRLLIVLKCDFATNYERLKKRGREREIKQYIKFRDFKEYHKRNEIVINLLKEHMAGKLFKNILIFDTEKESIDRISSKIIRRIEEFNINN